MNIIDRFWRRKVSGASNPFKTTLEVANAPPGSPETSVTIRLADPRVLEDLAFNLSGVMVGNDQFKDVIKQPPDAIVLSGVPIPQSGNVDEIKSNVWKIVQEAIVGIRIME